MIGALADAIVTSDCAAVALRLLPFLGFADSGTVVTRYARPIRPFLYLRGAEAARCLRNTLLALRAPAAAPGVQRSHPVGAEELGGAPRPWPAPRYGGAVLERSAAVMSYWLQCPAAPMELPAGCGDPHTDAR